MNSNELEGQHKAISANASTGLKYISKTEHYHSFQTQTNQKLVPNHSTLGTDNNDNTIPTFNTPKSIVPPSEDEPPPSLNYISYRKAIVACVAIVIFAAYIYHPYHG